MSAFASWCFRRRKVVLLGWVLALLGLAAAAIGAGTAFTSSVALPHSESATAYSLLATMAPGSVGTKTGNIAWQTRGEPIDAASVQASVATMLDAVSHVPGVVSVVSPYSSAGAAQLNAGASTAFARVTVTGQAGLDQIRTAAEQIAGPGISVALGGPAFTENPKPSSGTEGLGILAALVILFIAFRSRWAAVLPILTGVVGVGASILTVLLATHVIDLPSESITMASMIGLGVGIDYALFIVNRHRKALVAGASVRDAVVRALDTSGRAVVFAGLTVMVALVGMVVVGLSMLTAMALAAAVAVLFTVLTALTLLPALLGMLGHRVLSPTQRRALASGGVLPSGVRSRAGRWSLTLMRRPVPLALAGIAVLVALAVPALSIRVGNADSSADPAGSNGRTYFDMMTPAFGAGVDATLVLVAETPDAGSAQAFQRLVGRLPSVPDVTAVQAAPIRPGQTLAVATVVPSSSAQTVATQDLVTTLRSDVIPAAASGSALRVYVGGETASNIDLANALTSKLPLYLGLIALLGFVLLAIAFRSVVVPLVGALSNLLTIAVGLGIVTAVFQLGWGSELLGAGGAAPIMWIIPVILTGVMFGLSMDYQVFLVSRMHEEWTHTHDNRRAVRVGLRETLPVIVSAATIMFSVFASFAFAGQRIVAGMGVGLAVAVLADAFLTRLVVMPALLRLIGSRTWWYPRWADRITPHLSVEGASDDELTRTDGLSEELAAGVDVGIAAGPRG
jgi:RND superfamily putative drug exporter